MVFLLLSLSLPLSSLAELIKGLNDERFSFGFYLVGCCLGNRNYLLARDMVRLKKIFRLRLGIIKNSRACPSCLHLLCFLLFKNSSNFAGLYSSGNPGIFCVEPFNLSKKSKSHPFQYFLEETANLKIGRASCRERV